jgi:hypothetical protein
MTAKAGTTRPTPGPAVRPPGLFRPKSFTCIVLARYDMLSLCDCFVLKHRANQPTVTADIWPTA